MGTLGSGVATRMVDMGRSTMNAVFLLISMHFTFLLDIMAVTRCVSLNGFQVNVFLIRLKK
jgi:hypothetical protein